MHEIVVAAEDLVMVVAEVIHGVNGIRPAMGRASATQLAFWPPLLLPSFSVNYFDFLPFRPTSLPGSFPSTQLRFSFSGICRLKQGPVKAGSSTCGALGPIRGAGPPMGSQSLSMDMFGHLSVNCLPYKQINFFFSLPYSLFPFFFSFFLLCLLI